MGSESTGAQKTVANLNIIVQQWALTDASQVLPQDLAPRTPDSSGRLPNIYNAADVPPLDPYAWPRSYTESLRKLSWRSQGHHDRAVQWLYAEVAFRHSRDDIGKRGAGLAVKQLAKADIESVVSKWDQQLAAGRAQGMAAQASEQLEENEANMVFSGGLMDALPKVEDEPTYQMGGSFTIALR